MADDYFFSREGKQYGPVSAGQLKKLADAGRLLPTDQVRRGDMPNWVSARAVKGLFAPPPSSPSTPAPAPIAPQPAEPANLFDDTEEPVVVAEVVEAELLGEDDEPPAKLRRKRPAGSGDLVENLKALASNPVQNLPEVYARLGPRNAPIVGLGAAAVYLLSFVLWVYFVLPAVYLLSFVLWVYFVLPAALGAVMVPPDGSSRSVSVSRPDKPWKNQEAEVIFKSLLGGAVWPVGIFLGSLASRKLFHGAGCLESDVFLAGVATLPSALDCLVQGFFALLGVSLPEAYAVIMLLDLCLSFLILYAGCARLNRLSPGACTLSLPLILFIPLLSWDIMVRYILF